MDFFQWIGKVAEFLGYRPDPNGVEEESIKSLYYTKGKSPEAAAFLHKQSLQGPPAREHVIRHF